MSIAASILKAMTATRSATADALGVVDQIREEIAALHVEIDRLEAAPQPIAAAMASFDAWAARIATAAVDDMGFGLLLDPNEAGKGLALPHHVMRIEGAMVFDYEHATRTLLGLLIASNLPALRKIVADQLADRTASVETLTPEAREKKLAQTRARLLEVELAEEAAVRALEAAGVSIDRRPGADPRALLADNSSLPV